MAKDTAETTDLVEAEVEEFETPLKPNYICPKCGKNSRPHGLGDVEHPEGDRICGLCKHVFRSVVLH